MQPITTAEVAKILGVSQRTVQRMIASGQLVPAYTLPTGNLFNRADVERLDDSAA